MEEASDTIKELVSNYYVLVPVVGLVSGLYFYMTGETNTYQQKKKLQSDSIRNGVFVGMLTLLVVFIHSSNSDPEFIGSMSDSVLDGLKDVEKFATGLPNMISN